MANNENLNTDIQTKPDAADAASGLPPSGTPSDTPTSAPAPDEAAVFHQKLVELDQPIGSVSPAWANEHTAKVTFRHLL